MTRGAVMLLSAFCVFLVPILSGCDGTGGDGSGSSDSFSISEEEGSIGQTCGGIAGLTCDLGQICDMSENSVCGVDLEGVCAIPAEICTTEFDPVCGCNDVTYANDCERQRAGVALQSRGECRGGEKIL
jgi:hypothetical protein